MRGKLVGAIIMVTGAAIITTGVGGSSASPAKREGKTLVVLQSPPQQQYVDLADPGPSPGDQLVIAGTLSNPVGIDVGDLHITCTQNFDQVAVCLGIFDLFERGKISVDASPVFPEPTVGMVTGGTGEFQNVRGEAHIDPLPDGTTMITFHLFG